MRFSSGLAAVALREKCGILVNKTYWGCHVVASKSGVLINYAPPLISATLRWATCFRNRGV